MATLSSGIQIVRIVGNKLLSFGRSEESRSQDNFAAYWEIFRYQILKKGLCLCS